MNLYILWSAKEPHSWNTSAQSKGSKVLIGLWDAPEPNNNNKHYYIELKTIMMNIIVNNIIITNMIIK